MPVSTNITFSRRISAKLSIGDRNDLLDDAILNSKILEKAFDIFQVLKTENHVTSSVLT